MEGESVAADPPARITTRSKCSACYKQYKKKEHLIEHMKQSFHSVHQPKCGVCKKHFKSFESLREHITGPLPNANCAKIFTSQGCDLCMNIFDGTDARDTHKAKCYLSPPPHVEPVRKQMESLILTEKSYTSQGPGVVAIDCEMVGGGSDGSLDICARVCLIDEDENMIFHAFVEPLIPITNYRYEITGITEEHMRDPMSLKQVHEKIQEILYNRESIWTAQSEGGKARLLVGHNLEHDLSCLRLVYPDHLLRDTAKYQPLLKTNLGYTASHSLKYLTKTYLGYEIQSGTHNPYEDCVAAMRLYKRMCSQIHPVEGTTTFDAIHGEQGFMSRGQEELENMSPDALFQISQPNYKCWCLDSRPITKS